MTVRRVGWPALALITLVLAGCSAGTSGRAKVSVVNPTNRPLLVSITTDGAAWAWRVEPGFRFPLLDEPASLEGRIELIDPEDCRLYDAAEIPSGSFTIEPRLVSGSPLDFELTFNLGAITVGQPNLDFFGGCSG